MMAVKSCRVTCNDSRGIAHSVEVTAETLYEAVAKGLRVLRENEWSEDCARIPPILTVRIKEPEIEHMVRTKDFERWLESPPKNPREMSLKNRIQAILRE